MVIFWKPEVWESNSVTRQVSFSSPKVDENAKNCEFGQFLKTWGQTALPEKSLLIGKLVENANIKKIKCDMLSDFQTLCISVKIEKLALMP